jgi:hypothetical protein
MQQKGRFHQRSGKDGFRSGRVRVWARALKKLCAYPVRYVEDFFYCFKGFEVELSKGAAGDLFSSPCQDSLATRNFLADSVISLPPIR